MTGKSETIRLQGVDVEVVRKGSGPPLLLLHGGAGPFADQPFAEALAERFEIVAPTHPGFNGTRIPDHFDGMPDLVFLYLDLLDALKLDAPTVIGFSMGGWLGAELAVLPGTNFSKLILVDAVGVKIGGPTDRDIADIFGMPPQDAARLLWHDPARAPSTDGLPDEAFETMAVNRIALGLYTWEPFMHNPKLRHRLHRITAPTLLIWGASDGVVKPDYGKAYAGLIPGARFAVVPDAGHLPHIEQPDAFVSQVLAFTE